MLHFFVGKQAQAFSNGSLSAIQFENSAPLTYKQLDAQSEQIASYLHKQFNIQQGDIVSVLVSRSTFPSLILLSLSKLGAIYVPLDPACPEQRLRLIIEDCKPKLTILEEGYALPIDSNSVTLTTTLKTIAENKSVPADFPHANNNELIAYIVYTSGTTGKPKGVPIKHSGFDYWAQVLQEKTNLSEKSRVLDFMSIGFDANIWQVLMAWSFGACLHIVNEETRTNVNKLVQFMLQHQITDATLIPALIRHFNLPGTLAQLKASGLTNIYSTGEACTPDILNALAEADINLWNCYGPTEATFGMSIIQCHHHMLSEGIMPIALPYGDEVTAYILNEEKHPVTAGEIGELHIQSPYLTPGYLNRPEETQKRFIEISQSGKQVRLYATEDLFSQNGNYLYYHGRKNHLSHIKINGILVNPQETEDCLRNQPDIIDACVLVYGERSPRLVSFIVSQNNDLSTQILYPRLHNTLADVAIPIHYFLIDSLPRTVNGKIDRDKLNQMLPSYIANIQEHMFSTSLEQQLARLWEKLLPINCFDGHSDFRQFGGDSCKIQHLISMINHQFFLKIKPHELFDLPAISIHHLAKLILDKQFNETVTEVFFGEQKKSAIILAHAITGDASFTYQPLIAHLKTLNVPIYCIDANGLDFTNNNSLQECTERYTNSLLTLNNNTNYYVIGWSSGGAIAWKIAEHLEAKGKKVRFLGLIDSIAPTVYRSLDNESFAAELLELVNRIINIASKEFHTQLSFNVTPKILMPLSSEKQIAYVFNILAAQVNDNPMLLKWLRNIQWLINAVQTASFNQCDIKPTIFRSQHTIDKLTEYRLTADRQSTFGWTDYHKQVQLISSSLNENHFELIGQKQIADLLLDSIKNKIKKDHSNPTSPCTEQLLWQQQQQQMQISDLQKSMKALVAFLSKGNGYSYPYLNRSFSQEFKLPAASCSREETPITSPQISLNSSGGPS